MIPTDYLLISAAGNFILLGITGVTLIALGNQKRRAKRAERKWEALAADYDFVRGALTRAQEARAGLVEELFKHERKAAERSAKAKLASIKGHAVQTAKARAKHEAATAKTVAEFARTPMRSRAKVVAPVKAKRTRMKNSGAASAA